MIISEKGSTLVLVRQEDHGELAGELVRHWGNELFEAPQPRESAYFAARHHDRGWRSPDQGPLFDEEGQGPRNFLNLDFREHVRFYEDGVQQVIDEDPYAGLLVSMHWTGLYRGRWGMQGWLAPIHDEQKAFLDEVVDGQERRWIELKKLIWDRPQGSRPEFEARLWYNYQLLQCWDLLSLYVSRQKYLNEPYTLGPVPLRLGGESRKLVLQPREDGQVALDPYPFDTPGLVCSVVGREIPKRAYGSAEEVRAALEQAEEVVLRCTFVPGK